jgi:hypothetical protein
MDVRVRGRFQGEAVAEGARNEPDWLETVAESLAQAEPDRYLSALLAPRGKRPQLLALYGLNHVISRVPAQVSEPMLGEIRLQWWRDELERAARGTPERHPVLQAVSESGLAAQIGAGPLESLTYGWGTFLYPEDILDWEGYWQALRATDGALMELAVGVTATRDHPEIRDWAREAGAVTGAWRDLRAALMDGRQPDRAPASVWPADGSSGGFEMLAEHVPALRGRRLPFRRALAALLPFTVAAAEMRRAGRIKLTGGSAEAASVSLSRLEMQGEMLRAFLRRRP